MLGYAVLVIGLEKTPEGIRIVSIYENTGIG